MIKFIFNLIKTIIFIILGIIVLGSYISYKDMDYKNISEIDDEKIRNNLTKALEEIQFEPDDVKSIYEDDEWAMGRYYSFYYHGSRYYFAVYETGDIHSISKKRNDEYIYRNDNINITDETENSITLQWNNLGEYGRYDTYDGEKYMRYYIPAGTYTVKALNKGSMFFIEKQAKYKTSDGYEESAVVNKIKLSNIGDTDTITINSDECISLVVNSYISFQKQ